MPYVAEPILDREGRAAASSHDDGDLESDNDGHCLGDGDHRVLLEGRIQRDLARALRDHERRAATS